MRVSVASVCGVVCLLAIAALPAQEREDRALLPWGQMQSIINEASGDRAMHHVLELVPYPRVRPLTEYTGNFRESEVMARFARDYGYSDVRIESFPTANRLWQPTVGELWMVEPQLKKIYDIHDVAVSLAANSAPGDVTAELVDVGTASDALLDGKDLKGKIVLASSGVAPLPRALQRGAVGILGMAVLRPDDYPDQIISSSVAPPEGSSTFGWAISPRVNRELSALLASGKKVVLRSVVKAEYFPGELEVVHATIPGDGSSDQEVFVSGHLYEGYIKQGANDDNSGCALTLEMGRTYLQLIKDGKLPKPKRTIRFLWVPEISGTNAWLNKYPDVAKRAIADLNFDMEGLKLSASSSMWVLHRTPDTFPTFLNDIAQSFMEYVAELNRERVRYRSNGYVFTYPIVSPNGSRDPFYIKIDKHFGASDHVTYMQHGIPSVMFITWPDMWYHSSQDTPDKQDPTQYKRAAVVGVGAMAVLATGGDELATKVTAETLARGSERVGEAQRKATSYLADARDAAALSAAYREGWLAVKHQAAVEKQVIRSSKVLYVDPAAAEKKLAPVESAIDKVTLAVHEETRAMYALAAGRVQGTAAPTGDPILSDAERMAARTVVEPTAPAGGRGAGGGRGGGGGGRGAAAAGPAVPQHMNAELTILINQRKTVLEIRDFLSAEFEPLPLDTLMAVLKAREASGALKLVEQADKSADGKKPTVKK
jgi:Zn-dependent M28 family amino/carboxypeptidase